MPIYSTLTDYEIENQSIRNYGDGKLDQWLLYQGKGAEKFYNSYVATNPFYDEVEGVGAITKKDLANFAIRNLFGDKNLAFVSLGCGNSSIGEYILQAVDAKPVPHYIGVDSSMWMLEESEKIMKNSGMSYDLICADFSGDRFVNKITNLGEQYTKKAFAFLGCTFGNIKHTRIVDVLSHMLLAGERIWIEVPLRKDCTDRGNLELIETYKGYLLDEGKRNFLCQKMLEDGINIENGTLGLEVTPVESIGALLFTFIFTFNKKTEAMIGGKNIIFSPNRKIELLKIHRYTPEGLISYFEQQNFTLVDKEIKGFDGQFVFEKK